VEGPARVAIEPSGDFRVLVASVIVEDAVDELAGRDRGLDGVEETDELLVPMALHAATEDRTLEDIEGGEQGRGAVPDIVVREGSGLAGLKRQAGLGPIAWI
jgi:hypothetical protein